MQDPDGNKWEVYVLLDDQPEEDDAHMPVDVSESIRFGDQIDAAPICCA